jgi:hypothetical protein
LFRPSVNPAVGNWIGSCGVFSTGVFFFGNYLNFSVGEWTAVSEPTTFLGLASLSLAALLFLALP